MSCLVCAENLLPKANQVEIKEEDNKEDEETTRSLCTLFELKWEVYRTVLGSAGYCKSCRQLLREAAKVNEAKITEVTSEASKIKDVVGRSEKSDDMTTEVSSPAKVKSEVKLDSGTSIKRKEQLQSIVTKSLISSWMKRQSENLQAQDYCAWHSARLKILLDIGAVMEMECHHHNSALEPQLTKTTGRGYQWTESAAHREKEEQAEMARIQSIQKIYHSAHKSSEQQDQPRSELSQNIGSIGSSGDSVILTTEGSSQVEPNRQVQQPQFQAEKGRPSTSSDEEKGRRSKRKPLRPTKGIYKLQPQNSAADIQPFGSRLRELLTMKKDEQPRERESEAVTTTSIAGAVEQGASTETVTNLNAETYKSVPPEEIGSEAVIRVRAEEMSSVQTEAGMSAGAASIRLAEAFESVGAESVPNFLAESVGSVRADEMIVPETVTSVEAEIAEKLSDVKPEDDANSVKEPEKPKSEAQSNLESFPELLKSEEPSVDSMAGAMQVQCEVELKEEEDSLEEEPKPEPCSVEPLPEAFLPVLEAAAVQVLSPPIFTQSIEEIEAAAALNIMKHSKESLSITTWSSEPSPEKPTRRSLRAWKRRRGNEGVTEGLRPRRMSFSPDITAELPKKRLLTEVRVEEEFAEERGKKTRGFAAMGAEPLRASVTTNQQQQQQQQEVSEEEAVRSKAEKFRCSHEDCGRIFPTAERRDNHYKRHHEGIRNLFSCHICGKSFPARTRLATHLERHEQEGKSYPCGECGKTFATQKKLDFHLYQHSQNWGLYCDICNKGFPPGQELRLANHKKIHDSSRPRPFKCSECDRTFSSQQYLNIHTKNHPITPDPDGLFRCPFESCRQAFKAVTSYREHTKLHTGELPFQCSVCGKKFGYITGYKKHMISHTDEKQHTCHICGKQFKQKGNLNLHISRHAGVKPFKCSHPGCGYSFFDQYKLKNHMDVHTGRRSFKCDDCDKYFRTSTGLKSHHQAVHAKERKYKCHCGKAFTQKQYLQFHKTQHPELNLKRFTCDFCAKKFSEPSSLREHKRRFHTGETAFQCDKCSYTACFKSRMDKHLLTHASPQLKCPSCDKLFRHQNNLQRHVATVHTKNKGSEEGTDAAAQA